MSVCACVDITTSTGLAYSECSINFAFYPVAQYVSDATQRAKGTQEIVPCLRMITVELMSPIGKHNTQQDTCLQKVKQTC